MILTLTDKQADTLVKVLANYREPRWDDPSGIEIDRDAVQSLKSLVKYQYGASCAKRH